MKKSNFDKTRFESAFGPVSGSRLSVVLRAAVAVGVAASLSACALAPDKSPSLTVRQQRGKEIYDYWQAQCAKAGVFVYSEVPKLDGIALATLSHHSDFYAQYKYDDPYGEDDSDIWQLGNLMEAYPALRGAGVKKNLGVSYVELLSSNNEVTRYTVLYAENGHSDYSESFPEKHRPWLNGDTDRDDQMPAIILRTEKGVSAKAKYMLIRHDISTPEDREHWTAGSSLQLVERVSGKVVAERIGYMADVQDGDKARGRMPWPIAARHHACPSFEYSYLARAYGRTVSRTEQLGQLRRFLDAIHAIPER